jgi:hypothetical protein
MSSAWLEPNLVGVCFIAVVGVALGLVSLLAPGRGARSAVVPAALAAAFGGASAALAAAGQPTGYWLGPLVVAVPCAAFAALRTPWPVRGLSTLLGWAARPRLQGAALLIACPVLALGWSAVLLPTPPEFVRDPGLVIASQPVGIRPVAATGAATDAGRPVPLYFRAKASDEAALKAGDAAVFSFGQYAARAIRTAPPTEDYNCHGWVFTGGRFWVQAEDVETILEDNGYQPAADPLPGDLALYRGSSASADPGPVLHSGVVLTAGPGHPVLVESKWGKSGRYVHAPDAIPYPGEVFYYRSSRAGHLLNNLGPSPAEAQ